MMLKIAQTKNLHLVSADLSYKYLPEKYKNGNYVIWGEEPEEEVKRRKALKELSNKERKKLMSKEEIDKMRQQLKITSVQSIGSWGGMFRQAHLEEIDKDNSLIYIIEVYELRKSSINENKTDKKNVVVLLIWHYDTTGKLMQPPVVQEIEDMKSAAIKSQLINNGYGVNGKKVIFLGEDITTYTQALAKTTAEFSESREPKI